MSASAWGGADRHADLAGLGNDDHKQYLLRSGAQPAAILSGSLTSVTGAYTLVATDAVVLAGGAGGYTVTVPSASLNPARIVIVKNTGSASITVAATSGNVEGAASLTLPVSNSVTLASDGTNWWII